MLRINEAHDLGAFARAELPSAAPPPRKPKARMPRSAGLFDQTLLDWLTDRHWNDIIPARLWLYHYMRIKSLRGLRPVTLSTYTMALMQRVYDTEAVNVQLLGTRFRRRRG